VIRDVHIEPPHVVKKRSIDQPLRILLYYDESVYRWVVFTWSLAHPNSVRSLVFEVKIEDKNTIK
jgi:hypothetical protein